MPRIFAAIFVLTSIVSQSSFAQQPPYDVFPDAKPPYYRVRYDATDDLKYAVNYTVWIPPNLMKLRGVIVHQHGCGEGSCKSGLTGGFDLHWQALAKKHDCALLAPAYEQPDKADCQMWCDPRNGSGAAFQMGLKDLAKQSGHLELATVPWALWGHSGGGHWAGGMVLTHPNRVAAAWLRSGVPLLETNADRPSIKFHTVPDAALKVPIMCNPGTKEGVTVKDGRFSGVWPANVAFFGPVRKRGGLIGVAIDPLTAHECGNQRYMAIAWLDECLSKRLPKESGGKLADMPLDDVWLADIEGKIAVPMNKYESNALSACWLPSERIAKSWMQYVKDTKITDKTEPPAPKNVRVDGNKLIWDCEADLESGLSRFTVFRDGKLLAHVPDKNRNPFGRPVFQGLLYSDTPIQPLQKMEFVDTDADGTEHQYEIVAENTVGLASEKVEAK